MTRRSGGRWSLLLTAVTWLAILFPGRSINGELYTALVDMEELLTTESVLIDTLNGFISAQEQRLATLRRNAYEPDALTVMIRAASER
ncbi:hypothetical protein TKK_0006993 [Trichogramma kaykai]